MPRSRLHREKKDIVSKRAKSPYQKRDRQILAVAMYLNSKGDDGATIHNIIHDKSVGLSTQDHTRFTKVIMEPMERDGWVRRVVHSSRVSVYKITPKGSEAISEALQLRRGESLLSKLEAFQGFG